MSLQLEGKAALVTGASRGIGKVIARTLAQHGVDVVIAARSAGPLEATAVVLAAETGRRIIPIVADTADDASVRALIEAAVAALGKLDILVNNAATPAGASATGARLESFRGQDLLDGVNVKVGGYLRLAQAATPHLIGSGHGRIINIAGLAARSTGNYMASIRNAAISALTKNLADEYGRSGLTANAIHPGVTRTEKTDEARAQQAGQSNTIGRIVEAEEIAWLVAVLASPLSGALNGQTLAAGGGTPKVIDY